MCDGLNHLIFVPTDSFYDYVKSGNFPKKKYAEDEK